MIRRFETVAGFRLGFRILSRLGVNVQTKIKSVTVTKRRNIAEDMDIFAKGLIIYLIIRESNNEKCNRFR